MVAAFLFTPTTWLVIAVALVAGNVFTLMLLRTADRADHAAQQDFLLDVSAPAPEEAHEERQLTA